MGHSVFFSVSGSDAKFADDIAARYTRDLIYCFPSSGVEGVDFWREVEENELPYARAFVIFWSKSYLANAGTRRELRIASRLFQSGQIRHALVLRLDDTPLFADSSADQDEQAVYDALKPFLERVRASAATIGESAAALQVDRLVREQSTVSLPIYPRPLVIEALADAARIDHYTFYPAVWVGGLNGTGRRTTIREFFKQVDGNASPVEVDITEAAVPKQMLLRLESEAFSAPPERLAALAADDASDDPKTVARVLERVFDQGRYVILRQERIYEDRAVPPEWVAEMIKALTPRTRPMLFIIAQVRCPDDLKLECTGKLGSYQLPRLTDDEALGFTRLMLRALDRNPARWGDEDVSKIATGTGGTPELLIAIIKILSNIDDRDLLDSIIGNEAGRFADAMTSLIGWAYNSISDLEEEPRVLLFLNNVGATTATDIAQFIDSPRPISSILRKLTMVGLVDQDELDLYRLPALFSKRLNKYIADPALARWYSEAMKRYVATPVDMGNDEHGYIRIETKIAASLWIGDSVPDQVKSFVTAAHYLQAGIRAYNARKRKVAFNNIKRAFDMRASFGLTAKLEVARYLGLAAAQIDQPAEIEEALKVLNGHYLGKPMALYLRGFAAERKRDYGEAITCYRKAVDTAKQDGQTTREAQAIRPLVNCILRSRQPNFGEAVALSKRAVTINRSFFSLMMLAKAFLHMHFKAQFPNQTAIDDSYEDYEVALRDLEQHPSGGDQGYAQIRAEEAAFMSDFQEAAAWMKVAIDCEDRIDLWLKRWRYLTMSGATDQANIAMREIENVVRDPRYRDESYSFLEVISEQYALSLNILNQLRKEKLDQIFPQLAEKENVETLSRVRRARNREFAGDF